jgi:cellulose synthase/poly-beta-1,6-N-acetylglucosamine synthase-like glycosyltransferase
MLFWTSGGSTPPDATALRVDLLRPGQRPTLPQQPQRSRATPDLARYLVDRSLLSIGQMLAARGQMRQDRASIADIALNEGWLDAATLLQARADCFGLRLVNAMAEPPDPALSSLLDPATCLRLSLLPWRQLGDGTILMITSRPETFAAAVATLPAPLHLSRAALTTSDDLEAAIARQWREDMARNALTRVPLSESCRTWAGPARRRIWLLSLTVLALLALVLTFPVAIFGLLALWAGATLLVAALHKAAAVAAFLTRPDPPQADAPSPSLAPSLAPPLSLPEQRPVVSILVPLYREPEVADILIRRLDRLTYPRALLDVLLILEEGDSITRYALSGIALPPWIRVIPVPDGQPRTKPRAMNYALDFCRGDIVGIYDAEDAPDPDQIDRVAARFAQAPPDLVCLQGVLDYYNPRQNWLARCFTIEYASWFRVMMPGMARLGFAIPLGGTTLFFRRSALERLGGWDAHNVTEDADLGFRLARHGYRTEMMPSTTAEEANCHPLPWIRQRSRWLKGYMVTYLVHMRSPRLLLRQLGLWRFIGYQTHFITALSQFLLAPVLWSFWLVLLGLPHPLDGALPGPVLMAIARLFLMVEVLTIATGLLAVSGRAHRHLLFWVPTLQFYFPLGALAAYKALYELVAAPFYWDKTAHGHSLRPRAPGLVRRLLTRRF